MKLGRTKYFALNLRLKLTLVTLIPLLGMAGAISTLIFFQYNNLVAKQADFFRQTALEIRKNEIKNYLQLAVGAIYPYYTAPFSESGENLIQAKRILNRLSYVNEDGYFFVYDYSGKNLVHPKLPHLVGKDLWNHTDLRGNYMIRALIDNAKSGGGYHTYFWNKPSTGKETEKISYSTSIPEWGWMIGTGFYLDDIQGYTDTLLEESAKQVDRAFGELVVLTFFLFVLIAVFCVFFTYNAGSLADERLKRLYNRLINERESERFRISKDLHDGVNPYLLAIKYQLETLAEKRTAPVSGKTIPTLQEYLGAALSEIRNLISNLAPFAIKDLGLERSILNYVSDFCDRHRLTCRSCINLKEESALTDEMKTSVFRIVQESLNNVQKHAKADNVEIRLKTTGTKLILCVSDDGKGMETHKRKKEGKDSFGLRNIAERTEYHGGNMRIRTRTGKGTALWAYFPLKKPETAEGKTP